MVDATDLKYVEPYKLVRVRVSLPPSFQAFSSLVLRYKVDTQKSIRCVIRNQILGNF